MLCSGTVGLVMLDCGKSTAVYCVNHRSSSRKSSFGVIKSKHKSKQCNGLLVSNPPYKSTMKIGGFVIVTIVTFPAPLGIDEYQNVGQGSFGQAGSDADVKYF